MVVRIWKKTLKFIGVNGMGRAIEVLRNYWDSRILGLTAQKWAEKLYMDIGGEGFVVDNPGTLIKLLFLWSYMRFPYLHIMASQRHKHRAINPWAKLFYFDPYAGNGIVRVKVGEDNELTIPGSAMLALLAPILLHKERSESKTISYYQWDIIALNDIRNDYKGMLITRYKYLFKNISATSYYKIHTEFPPGPIGDEKITIITSYDCTQPNTWLNFKEFFNAAKGQNGWIHGLLFLDPPSPSELPLKYLPPLLSVPSDVIALLHTGVFAESVSKKKYKPETLENILNCDSKTAQSLLQQTHRVDELEDVYLRSFCNLLRKTEIEVVKGSRVRNAIKSIRLRTRRRHYHLIVATRTTGGADFKEWQNRLNQFAAEVETLSDVNRIVIDILRGRQTTLKI
jgi:hypothetical protein